MRGIIAYIKRSIGWLCIVIVCEVIMIATMMLNEIAFAEILYGIFISLFLLLILLVFDAARYYRHYQKIKELEHSIMLSTDGMPETADLLEMSIRSCFGYWQMNIQDCRVRRLPDRKICRNIMPCGCIRSRRRSLRCVFCFRIKMKMER